MSDSASIVITDSAAKKVYDLLTEEKNYALNLRAFVQGGGCSGFQYGFQFDDAINEDDMVFKKSIFDPANPKENVISLLVDSASFQYLVGSEIDYRVTPSGGEFVIRNPNAKTTCGCGSSFSS